MAGRFVKQYILQAPLEGLGLRKSESFPDWEEDPSEDEIDGLQSSNLQEAPEAKLIYTTDLSAPSLYRNIRLLELLPGELVDPIQCRLTTHRLEPHIQKYEALSYCWGESNPPRQICIDGGLLEVTENLRSALRYLRHEKDSRILWVDAICINQSNLEERSTQVKLMGEIYRAAGTVLVWLGRAENFTKSTFELARNLAVEAEQESNTPSDVKSKKGKLSRLALHSDQTAHFEALVASKWFERCWTVQEFLSARRCLLFCGRETISWQEFSRAILYHSQRDSPVSFEQHWEAVFSEYQALQTLHDALVMLDTPQKPEQRLLALVSRFRSRQATNPHDRIYAFLGLIEKVQDLEIRIDYRMEIADLYRNVAARIITLSQNLDLLKFAPLAVSEPTAGSLQQPSESDEEEKLVTMPSWAPNWINLDKIAIPFEENPGQTREKIKHDGDVQISDDHSVLTLAGYIVDEIIELSPVLPNLEDLGIFDGDDEPVEPEESEVPDEEKPLRQELRELGQYFSYLYKLGGYNFGEVWRLMLPMKFFVRWEEFAGLPPRAADKDKSKQSLVREYWQTISIGALLPEGFDATEAAFWKWYHTLDPIRNWQQRWYKRLTSVADPMMFAGHSLATWSQYTKFDLLIKFASRRRLARTKNGRLALVPRTAHSGDKVMLCNASRYPLIIRQSQNHERWLFIGQAYIHGLADVDVSPDQCEWLHFE